MSTPAPSAVQHPPRATVVVFGSLNMDLVTQAPVFPLPGETLQGTTFQMHHGGKGANQALACTRLGVPAALIGRVGQDAFGRSLRSSLQRAQVDVRGVQATAGATGTASIQVVQGGENTIVVVPGANHAVDHHDLETLEATLLTAGLLLLQLELPLPMVQRAAELAARLGVRVMLDPAPASVLPAELLRHCWLVTPNERETTTLTGLPVSTDSEVNMAARRLLELGARQVIVKRGGAGAYWTDGPAELFWPAYPVHATDTVAAGDAFNGGLAAAIAEGRPIREALAWASAAAAIAVTRPGAQASFPDRQETLQLVGQVAPSSPFTGGVSL